MVEVSTNNKRQTTSHPENLDEIVSNRWEKSMIILLCNRTSRNFLIAEDILNIKSEWLGTWYKLIVFFPKMVLHIQDVTWGTTKVDFNAIVTCWYALQ